MSRQRDREHKGPEADPRGSAGLELDGREMESEAGPVAEPVRAWRRACSTVLQGGSGRESRTGRVGPSKLCAEAEAGPELLLRLQVVRNEGLSHSL